VSKSTRILLTFLFTCEVVLGADIRESVVIVQSVPSETAVDECRSIAGELRKRSLNDLADRFDLTADGSFGSGYLAQDRHGRSVVVTNRHLVTFADSVTVILTWKDDHEDWVPIEHCRILYEDPDIDVAFVLLPVGAFEGTPRLVLAESDPANGETVWSTGYPGHYSIQSWKLEESVVTDHRVVLEKMGLPQFALFTEHSVPVSEGSSGGPLLVVDPSNPTTYRVAGLNTWTVSGPHSGGYAVSIEMLREVFSRVPDPAIPTGAAESVRGKVQEYIASLDAAEWQRFESGKYISSRMAVKQAMETVRYLLAAENTTEQKSWIDRMLGESLEETLRQAVFYRIWKTIHAPDRTTTLMSINEIVGVPGEQRVRTGLAAGKNVYFFEWSYDRGNWRVSDSAIPTGTPVKPKAQVEAVKPPREEKPAGGYPFPAGLTVGLGISSIPTIYGWRTALNQSVGYDFGFGRIVSAGVSLTVDAGAALVEYGMQGMPLILALQGEGRIGLPVELKQMTLFPFAKAGAKAGISTTGSGDSLMRISLEAGVGLFVRPSSRWSFGLELDASFATDAGVRLEGIPVKLMLVF
jgi:serine protease Do